MAHMTVFYQQISHLEVCADEVAEWLRRWTANPLGSARVGSNPIFVVVTFLFSPFVCCDCLRIFLSGCSHFALFRKNRVDYSTSSTAILPFPHIPFFFSAFSSQLCSWVIMLTMSRRKEETVICILAHLPGLVQLPSSHALWLHSW